jgi:hypothetical protein
VTKNKVAGLGCIESGLLGRGIAQHMQNPWRRHPRKSYAQQRARKGEHQAFNE